MDDTAEPIVGTTATDDDISAFGDAVRREIGLRPAHSYLIAALGAVAFRQKQASSKLSPVHQPVRQADGSRSGPRPIAPYCSATFASFATCPSSCTFLTDATTGMRRGCFVGANVNSMRLMQRLDASAALVDGPLRGTLIGLAEAHVIDTSFAGGVPQDGPRGGRPLRIHVAGDAANEIVARALGHAAARWRVRGGGPVWCYTHRWRTIPRDAWGTISIFASVETVDAVEHAIARGYAPAITLDAFEAERAYTLAATSSTRVLPCPTDVGRTHADGRPTTCVTCGWCFDDRRLHAQRSVIGFEAHGQQQTAAREGIRELKRATSSAKRHLSVL
jgi:hypothetical protein